ncbi:MAG: hypothetical protein AVDCRST_MAG89-5383, partial [uncultured Gemmatimonadetes bacterium]
VQQAGGIGRPQEVRLLVAHEPGGLGDSPRHTRGRSAGCGRGRSERRKGARGDRRPRGPGRGGKEGARAREAQGAGAAAARAGARGSAPGGEGLPDPDASGRAAPGHRPAPHQPGGRERGRLLRARAGRRRGQGRGERRAAEHGRAHRPARGGHVRVVGGRGAAQHQQPPGAGPAAGAQLSAAAARRGRGGHGAGALPRAGERHGRRAQHHGDELDARGVQRLEHPVRSAAAVPPGQGEQPAGEGVGGAAHPVADGAL